MEGPDMARTVTFCNGITVTLEDARVGHEGSEEAMSERFSDYWDWHLGPESITQQARPSQPPTEKLDATVGERKPEPWWSEWLDYGGEG
jgi:hypothetical protein